MDREFIMKVFVLLFVFSFPVFAKENLGPKQIAFKKAAIGLYKIYDIGMKRVVKKYNDKRVNPDAIIDRKYKEFGFNPDKKIGSLPEASYDKGIFQIKKIQFKYSFQNFLDGSFELVGKTYQLQCIVESECFYQFLEEYTPKEVSAISWLIPEAYANDNLHGLLKKDHMVLGAMKLVNSNMDKLQGGFFVPDSTQLAIKNANLSMLYASIRTEKEKYENQVATVRNRIRLNMEVAGATPTQLDSTYKIIKQLSEFEGESDFDERIEEYIGEDALSFTQATGVEIDCSW